MAIYIILHFTDILSDCDGGNIEDTVCHGGSTLQREPKQEQGGSARHVIKQIKVHNSLVL